MNVLVTGGRGYLGRYVIDGLIARGDTAVDYSRDLGPGPRHELHLPVLGELEDIPRLLWAIEEHGVERVVHTAAQSHPDVSLAMPLATVRSNVMGTCCVLEAARLSGIARVVVFSSECAYGHTEEEPVTETAPLRPRTPYGVTKAATEMLGHSYNECFGMDTIALRVAEVYGPGQVMPQVVGDAIRAAVRGRPFRLSRGRDQKLQLVHVRDAAAATLAACFVDEHGLDSYNITGGVQPTLGEVLDLLATLLPEAELDVGPGVMGGDRQGLFDIGAAQRDLGYVPRVTLEEGLHEYVAWLRENEF